ncbi:VOC family protein [Sulfuriferula nivalis]|uniref:Glyoxalase n=1 Tax=Sulfuriferula nivalis TaxID=2675298 RepID=A0A809RGX8_9PROT|nr:VOC family protein [Sulfuriferula nivalis]BBP00896.1 glyoxalase [Sulfuriferula nivalis]
MSLVQALRHVSLIVADLPRARGFYEGILDLIPNPSRPEMSFTGVWYDIGDTQIHLMCLPNPEQGLTRPAHGGRDRHAAFTVTDVALLASRLDAAGIHYTMSQSGRAALFCRDPDDNALEFVA